MLFHQWSSGEHHTCIPKAYLIQPTNKVRAFHFVAGCCRMCNCCFLFSVLCFSFHIHSFLIYFSFLIIICLIKNVKMCTYQLFTQIKPTKILNLLKNISLVTFGTPTKLWKPDVCTSWTRWTLQKSVHKKHVTIRGQQLTIHRMSLRSWMPAYRSCWNSWSIVLTFY